MNTNRWTGPAVKEVVWQAVLEYTNGDATVEFTNADIKLVCLRMYPNFKERNVEAQIISDCVNHPSRDHHYHHDSSEDRYFRIRRGRYRLYNPKRDKNV
jgi:hypothetical protein